MTEVRCSVRLIAELWVVALFTAVVSLFGARKKDALQHLDQAYELNQQSKTNNVSLAIGLIELDQDKYSDRVHKLLKQAANCQLRMRTRK